MRYETAKPASHPAATTSDCVVDGPVREACVEAPPAPPVSLLTLQFLAWVAAAPRTHADVMDAWRSTCPRQSVWEDTVIDGLVAFEGGTQSVVLTSRGRAVLDASAHQDAGHH